MRQSKAIAGSSIFFAIAPGVVAGLIPFWLTAWRMLPMPLAVRIFGAALVVAGSTILVHSFWRFISEGKGTPAPVAPTERLVTGGAYRFVRNPMYVSVLAVIFGQGLLLGQTGLFIYGGVVWIAVFSFVKIYEEPLLERCYGAEYEEYRRAVPGWLPRLTPWKGSRE
jgi:protein-S-isoprenylcysteine O-methyltransferase Ste14